MKNDDSSPYGPTIYRYTRAQAIEDGVLIDLTEWASETGFSVPVACTAAVWNEYVMPPKGTEALGQSARGRGHDVLWMLYNAIRRRPRPANGADDRVMFDVIFLTAPCRQKTVRLKAVCGPGDHGEPVVTIMQPDED